MRRALLAKTVLQEEPVETGSAGLLGSPLNAGLAPRGTLKTQVIVIACLHDDPTVCLVTEVGALHRQGIEVSSFTKAHWELLNLFILALCANSKTRTSSAL